MLPEDRHQDEDGGDEDEGEGDLRDGAGGEGLDVVLGAGLFVRFFVPAGEGGEEDEADEGEDDGDDSVPGGCMSALRVVGGWRGVDIGDGGRTLGRERRWSL